MYVDHRNSIKTQSGVHNHNKRDNMVIILPSHKLELLFKKKTCIVLGAVFINALPSVLKNKFKSVVLKYPTLYLNLYTLWTNFLVVN